jgi:hypothetical protein
MDGNKYHPVLENASLVKESTSGALLNVNVSALEAYKKQKLQFKKNNDMDQRILKLENDISDIKSILTTILEK